MAADYTKIHRLLKIIMLIQGSEGWTAAKLAEECGVVERKLTEQGQVITILAAPRPEGIPAVVGFAVSEELLERALHQVGPEWPPFFRLTL